MRPISIGVTPEMLEGLRAIAEARNTSVNQTIRDILESYIAGELVQKTETYARTRLSPEV